MEGLRNWCIHMTLTNLGLLMARYVEKLVWGWYAKMCGLRWVSTLVFGWGPVRDVFGYTNLCIIG